MIYRNGAVTISRLCGPAFIAFNDRIQLQSSSRLCTEEASPWMTVFTTQRLAETGFPFCH